MMSQRMQDAFNEQIKNEFYSSYIYLSMAAWLDHGNLPGMATWMRAQAQEEAVHAMKLFDHLLDRGAQPVLQPIPQPPVTFSGALEAFEQAHRHEQEVTRSINELYGLSLEERDFAGRVLLDWFISEQVEEEKTSGLVVEQLRMVGDDRLGLLLLDRELGQRKAGAGDGAAD
jgi:ferritin